MKNIDLIKIFEKLLAYYGPLEWWPADSPFEVCVGAILTQNTAWTNVEKAIVALKQASVLSPSGLEEIGQEQLAALIRPAGYYNLKSQRLKDFIHWLNTRFQGDLGLMFSSEWQVLREELLMVRGIGPETADAILLYAGEKPSFVVDAYTRRLFARLGLIPDKYSYEDTRTFFMERLPHDVTLFNEYHALIVQHCKQFCRKKPLCKSCPLAGRCCVNGY